MLDKRLIGRYLERHTSNGDANLILSVHPSSTYILRNHGSHSPLLTPPSQRLQRKNLSREVNPKSRLNLHLAENEKMDWNLNKYNRKGRLPTVKALQPSVRGNLGPGETGSPPLAAQATRSVPLLLSPSHSQNKALFWRTTGTPGLPQRLSSLHLYLIA